jgi:hypothetical protein
MNNLPINNLPMNELAHYTAHGMISCIDTSERQRAKGKKGGVPVAHRGLPLALYLLPVHKTIAYAVSHIVYWHIGTLAHCSLAHCHIVY